MQKKAIVAMSGGVDSSVAALLTREAGFEAIGVTLSLFPKKKVCGSPDDVKDAGSVAARLGLPFSVLHFEESFEEQVIGRFVSAYEQGKTPNPCIDCNRFIKFGKLMRWGEEMGYPYVATGHYARVEQNLETGRWLLRKGLDESKDQSYMLYSLTQEQLSRLLLPLGGLTKARVREIAGENGFLNAEKRDSQDICFVPDGDYASFIRRHSEKDFPPGDFVGSQGQRYGEHKGIIHYTVGQRKGLGLSFPQAMYVQRLDVEKNQVVLCPQEELFSKSLVARSINLISQKELKEPISVKAKVRYRQKEQPAEAVQIGPGALRVTFREPQRAITKGQAVVLYQGDVVVGGGVIAETEQ